MSTKYVVTTLYLASILALVGCRNYSVSVNDNVVYTPLPLFKDFTIADERLHNCVEQTIIDNKIPKASDLKQLSCSNAGISNLTGLEIFSAIEELNLAENAIIQIEPLSKLAQIRVLILRKNNIKNAASLLHLLHLRELDISENGKLACNDIQQLLTNFQKHDLKATLPEHCKKG